jgi:hypothetical protein
MGLAGQPQLRVAKTRQEVGPLVAVRHDFREQDLVVWPNADQAHVERSVVHAAEGDAIPRVIIVAAFDDVGGKSDTQLTTFLARGDLPEQTVWPARAGIEQLIEPTSLISWTAGVSQPSLWPATRACGGSAGPQCDARRCARERRRRASGDLTRLCTRSVDSVYQHAG